jgi:hypothetical protein
MSVLIKRIGGLCILASCLFISACGSAATQSPTVDPALIYTSAAQTVEAELTMTDVAGPATATITPFPLTTETPGVPTAILGNGAVLPTLPGPQTTDVSTTGTPAAATPTLGQVLVPTLPKSQAADKATWISNDPPDSALVTTDAKFDITWTMKNSGTTTWSKKYTIRYFSGNIIMEHKQFDFRAAVNPGDTGTFIVDAIAPSKPGTYSVWWKMTNDLGQNFGDMSLTIKVVKPDTTPQEDTATPKPTKTTSP